MQSSSMLGKKDVMFVCHLSRMGYFSADQSNRLMHCQYCKVIIHTFCPPQIGHRMCVRRSANIFQICSCIPVFKWPVLHSETIPSVIGIIRQCYWRWIFFSAIFIKMEHPWIMYGIEINTTYLLADIFGICKHATILCIPLHDVCFSLI